MWVPELLDCVLSLEDGRGGAQSGKKNGKREIWEKSEDICQPRGEFCVQDCDAELALCWGGWQCPALLGVCGRGHGHTPVWCPQSWKTHLQITPAGVQGAAAASSWNSFALSLMPANWQTPLAKFGYRFPNSDSPGNMCAFSYLKNVPSSRRNCNSFFNVICVNCRSGWIYQWLDLLKNFLNFVNLCL